MGIERLEELKAAGEDLTTPDKAYETIKSSPYRGATLIEILVFEHRDDAYIRGYDEGVANARMYLPECKRCAARDAEERQAKARR